MVKKISEWKNIYLDTGILLALFRCAKGNQDERTNFVKIALQYLSTSNAGNGKSRNFIISVITLSEIVNNENSDIIEEITGLLQSNNIELINFNEATAVSLAKDFSDILANKKLNALAEKMGIPTHLYQSCREWITRDMMIVSSAKEYNIDVILTLDEKSFLPLAKKLNLPCVVCVEENFRHLHGVLQACLVE